MVVEKAGIKRKDGYIRRFLNIQGTLKYATVSHQIHQYDPSNNSHKLFILNWISRHILFIITVFFFVHAMAA